MREKLAKIFEEIIKEHERGAIQGDLHQALAESIPLPEKIVCFDDIDDTVKQSSIHNFNSAIDKIEEMWSDE